MNTYESKICTLTRTQADAYDVLSDLRHLEVYADRIPADKVKNLHFEADSVNFEVAMLGPLTLRIVEREMPQMLKFGVDNAPVAANLWIQLAQNRDGVTQMKLTLRVDLPFMLKAMVGSRIQEGIDSVAAGITAVLNGNPSI